MRRILFVVALGACLAFSQAWAGRYWSFDHFNSDAVFKTQSFSNATIGSHIAFKVPDWCRYHQVSINGTGTYQVNATAPGFTVAAPIANWSLTNNIMASLNGTSWDSIRIDPTSNSTDYRICYRCWEER